MLVTIVSTTIGIGCSAFFSWFFTYRYYKRSLADQAREASAQISTIMNAVGSVQQVNRDLLLQKYLEDAIEEHRRSGSPIRVIDTLDSLTREEKAVLYDKVCMRVKGRPGKSNPYKGM